jgi:hypothetical protein
MVALPTSIVPLDSPEDPYLFFFYGLFTTVEVVLPPIFHDRVLTAEKEMGLGLIIARAQRAHRIKVLVAFTDVPAMRLLVIDVLLTACASASPKPWLGIPSAQDSTEPTDGGGRPICQVFFDDIVHHVGSVESSSVPPLLLPVVVPRLEEPFHDLVGIHIIDCLWHNFVLETFLHRSFKECPCIPLLPGVRPYIRRVNSRFLGSEGARFPPFVLRMGLGMSPS